MKDKNREVSTWIVPRWAINAFTQMVQQLFEGGGLIYVAEIIPHDVLNYLVITHKGSDEAKASLHGYLTGLFWDAKE